MEDFQVGDYVEFLERPPFFRPMWHLYNYIPSLVATVTTLGILKGRSLMHSTFVNDVFSDPLVIKSISGLIATLGVTGSAGLAILLLKWIVGSIAHGVGNVRETADERGDRRRSLAQQEAAAEHDKFLKLVATINPAASKSLRPGAIVRFHANTHSTCINGKSVLAGEVYVLDTKVTDTNGISVWKLQGTGSNNAYSDNFEVIG